MGRLQQVTGAFALAFGAALGGGCVNLHSLHAPGHDQAKANAIASETRVDTDVKQASAKVPASVPAVSIAAIARASVKDLPKGSATEISMAWQNRVAQLPDPSRNGAMIHGVVGQMFLFGSDYKAAEANGKLIVEMFDQTARPGVAEGARLGSWTYERDALKKLVTMDERFGKSYAVFLPWPEFDPTVSRVKLTVRYDPERGYPLYAPASMLTFDNGANKSSYDKFQSTNPFNAVAGFGGLPASEPAAPRRLPPLDPLPLGGRNAQNAATPAAPLPPNLPSLVVTPQR